MYTIAFFIYKTRCKVKSTIIEGLQYALLIKKYIHQCFEFVFYKGLLIYYKVLCINLKLMSTSIFYNFKLEKIMKITIIFYY